MRRTIVRSFVRGLTAGALVVGTFAVTGFLPASAAPHRAAAPPSCDQPNPPAWFHDAVVRSITTAKGIPKWWADTPYLAKIACWQATGFRTDFQAKGGPLHVWHGIFAMTVEEMQTIAGPWMIHDRTGYHLSADCFVSGWDACPHDPGNTATQQQIMAALRWIWLEYGTPKAAWARVQATGRFDSYPRPGGDNKVTTSPLGLCPVQGPNNYQDDFGERRTVGGYHPHWGNDMHANIGIPIVAPFDGFAVAHDDGWFGGKYVTVVGAKGYVRNGHMTRYGTLGAVKAGTVIGYVGETGDASGPHDHFEWHPWVVPANLHRSPFGFTRVLDAIDPNPFLNQVC
ncbi:MAG TPA: M23 family metallopeptidase [Actinomycetota bacterium]|nr:M23 family metallopeptidase [Actinomycetota bacterium]